ncbi:transaldolase [bacterium]|nr:transaldolase [bacterium]
MSGLLVKLHEAGVSPWLDNLKREMFADGSLAKAIREDGVRGQTSNPSIFQASITKGQIYGEAIAEMAKKSMDAEAIVWEIMVSDVRTSCDIFMELFRESHGEDGFVSLELDPTKAKDTEASLKQAKELVARVGRPNLMIKVPATAEGLPVVTELIAAGISVNVTLLFSVAQYDAVIEAWMQGLEKRQKAGQSLEGIHSVASFFVSRVDTEADKRMDRKIGEDASLAERYQQYRGKIAVANARLAYELFLKRTAEPRWKALEKAGASVQRPLWASTSTKNPSYKDTIYVDELIGPNCVNTMPDSTVVAFSDHGVIAPTLTEAHISEAHRVLDAFAADGFDLKDITENTLMTEGVDKFAVAYTNLVEAVEAAKAKLA